MEFNLRRNWRIEGNKRYLKGDYHSAIKLYSKAIKADELNYQAYFNRGVAYHDLGLFHEAITDFTRVISLNSNFSEVFKNRALSYYAINESVKALADYNRAIQLGGVS